MYHQGVYLHIGQGRMEAHERWGGGGGGSSPGPEVWVVWGERELVGRFVGMHFVGEGF